MRFFNSLAIYSFNIILALICILFLICTGCSSDRKQGKPTIIAPVKVENVIRKDVPRVLRVVGNVKASASVGITARVTGEILKVHFTEGQNVKAGQTLISLDDRPFVAVLREKEALLAKSQAQLNKAREDMNRYAILVRDGYVSRESYEKAVTDASTLESVVNSDAAALDSAKLQVQYCTLVAPISGRVGSLAVDKGNIIKENTDTPLLTIHTISPCYVAFAVPEHNLAAIFARMHESNVNVEATPKGGEPSHGILTLVDNEVDTRTGTIKLRATFENKDSQLWPGQFVSVSLPLGIEKDALLLPTPAVQAGRDGAYVYVVNEEERVEVRQIQPLFEFEGQSVVKSGLQEGDRVVVEGMVRLAPGLQVKIVP